VLLVALDGWIDAGQAAATVAAAIASAVAMRKLATFCIDDLLDSRARRPLQRLENGARGELQWVEPELLVGEDHHGLGIALLLGPEPDYKWKAFAQEVTSFAVSMRRASLSTSAAFQPPRPIPAPFVLPPPPRVPISHTRSALFPEHSTCRRGIADAIAADCTQAGIPSIGLWARVPHYVAGMAYAPAALALVEGLLSISGLSLDVEPLRQAATETRRVVDDLIAQSEEHTEMVRRLEARPDELVGDDGVAILPSGDEIAAELERFLRGELGGQ